MPDATSIRGNAGPLRDMTSHEANEQNRSPSRRAGPGMSGEDDLKDSLNPGLIRLTKSDGALENEPLPAIHETDSIKTNGRPFAEGFPQSGDAQSSMEAGHAKRGTTIMLERSSASLEGELDLKLEDTAGVDIKVKARGPDQKETIVKLSPSELLELTSSPEAIPIHVQEMAQKSPSPPFNRGERSIQQLLDQEHGQTSQKKSHGRMRSGSTSDSPTTAGDKVLRSPIAILNPSPADRPLLSSRTASTPVLKRKQSSSQSSGRPVGLPPLSVKGIKSPLLEDKDMKPERRLLVEDPLPSPMPASIPLPPMSVAAYLQLELSSSKPSPLYIHRSPASDFPYETSRVKIDRLLNFLLLPPQLELVLWFGALACLDAWLYTFTVLPLRFLKALYYLFLSCAGNILSEIRFLGRFTYVGLGRVWRRNRSGRALSASSESAANYELMRDKKTAVHSPPPHSKDQEIFSPSAKPSMPSNSSRESYRKRADTRHKRTRSEPSNLLPVDKADILKGLLIVISCVILMYFDASRMYHSIRGQAAIKLYVIYNVLEVFDRLLSAIGQDVLECLFSKETLERKSNGRSKVLRPFWLFLLALAYNIVHALALFYQVITLNVAVNSYSNALLTLLMSNQFVEIKSTVFKKFEKENLFQMTCADVVERFQLWLMLMIIASRNVIETNSLFGTSSSSTSSAPLRTSSILPSSFTMFPDWTGQIMGPFFLVLGTEMLVDWLKHAYISKFNLVKPDIYGRFLDVLAKDYYSNAFAEQNLTRRLGLPVIPLSCLFIRASVQTYQMFLATHLPRPLPSPSTSLSSSKSSNSSSTSPATTAALLHIDQLFRRALGRHIPLSTPSIPLWGVAWLPPADTMLAWTSTLVVFLLVFLVLLALKLLLGMALLAYARGRYAGMKAREDQSAQADGKRVGGWGIVEVDDDKRRWIYDDDREGLRKLREREREGRERERGGGKGFGGVERYSMVAKRIW